MRGASRAALHLGLLEMAQGRSDEAARCYEEHLRASRELGHWQGQVTAAGNLSNVCTHLGRLAEAQRIAEPGLRISRQMGARHSL